MDSKQSFHLWINKKTDKHPNKPDKTHTKSKQTAHEANDIQSPGKLEQAAAEETTEDMAPPVYSRTYIMDNPTHRSRLMNLFQLKPVVWSGIAAILIGLSLGFFMLFVMGGATDDGDPENSPVSQMSSKDNEKSNQTASEDQTVLKSIDLFALQGGVFNEQKSAESIQKAFQKAGYDPIMWQRDGKTYLFTAIASTKDAGKNLAATEEDVPEIYVKAWQTPEVQMNINQDTHKWLGELRDRLLTSVEKLSKGDTVDSEAWQSVQNSYPEEDKQLTPLYKKVEIAAKKLDSASLKKQHGLLLDIWKQWEKSTVD